jgi:hypothetical protein
MSLFRPCMAVLTLMVGTLLWSGCTTSMVLLHLHDKLTEGDPLPCVRLNSVERALQSRCGPFVPGSLAAKDVLAQGPAQCALTLAARDARFWPVLPELLARGAVPERCGLAPMVAMAQSESACAQLGAASQGELEALRWLARADARSVHHDVVRVLSCPQARKAGLTAVLDEWFATGQLSPGQLSFNPLGALHPSLLNSPLSRRLEAQGHEASTALSGYDGRLPSGFDAALQSGDLAALDWWIQRTPSLVNRAPPSLGGNLPWRPLARLLTPGYVPDPAGQRRTAEYLLARGADPWLRLPHEPQRTVLSLARQLNSPLLPLMEASHRPEDRERPVAHAWAARDAD